MGVQLKDIVKVGASIKLKACIIILFYHLLPEMYEKVKLLHGLGCLSCDTLTITLKLIKIQFQKTTF
jgi:hypothetical protein